MSSCRPVFFGSFCHAWQTGVGLLSAPDVRINLCLRGANEAYQSLVVVTR